jgi:branched-chain amino acid transport system substrate-binding protein
MAGPAAEGMVTTPVLNSARTDAKWQEFQKAYRRRFNDSPDAFAAYAYDGMQMLLAAISKVGLDRKQIMHELQEYAGKVYDGVTGHLEFDSSLNGATLVTLARVQGGKLVYLIQPSRGIQSLYSK